MKIFAKTRPEIPIVDHKKPDGTLWTLKEKLLLGLTPEEYKKQFFRNPLNWLLIFIFIPGTFFLLQRYFMGLDVVTHASNDYPWGLFLGFGLFTMVPLSASGFMLGTTVELFGRKDFHSIERLALLNGLLGYFFAVMYLMVDLGMPWRLPYPMVVSLGPAAVLFLVAWHVATYLSVQIAEVCPAIFEWLGWLPGKRFVRSIVMGLTVAGIILSTLHQGALGALFTYAPGKVHPLWYSANFQWIHFFCSSIFAGLSMVMVAATLCKNFLSWRASKEFLENLDHCCIGLGKGCAIALITYIVIKFVAIAHDNEWEYLLTGWGQYYMLEMTISAFIPLVLFTIGVRNKNANLIRMTAFLTVFGIVMNRLDTTLIAYNWQLYQEIPHFKEVWITITMYALYFITYRFIVYRMPIIYEWQGEK